MTTASLVLAQDPSRPELDFTVILLVSIFAGLLILQFQALPAVWYWLKAQAIGAPVGFFRVVVMRLRRESIARILRIHADARQAGLRIEIQRWGEHWMARGNLELLLEAVLIAHQGGLNLPARDPLPADHSPELNLFFWLASHNLTGGNPVAVAKATLAEGSARDMEAYRETCIADFARMREERNDAGQSGGASPVNA